MPLDTEIACFTHGKESVLHYDHVSQAFMCLQCLMPQSGGSGDIGAGGLGVLPDGVVEADRRIIMKGMHVLKEIMLKKIAQVQELVQ